MSLRGYRWYVMFLAVVWVVLGSVSVALGADVEMKIRAVLIWGTDGVRPDDAELKDLDVDTCQKLKAVFKWKHYYEVTHKDVTLAGNAAKKVRLSSKCEVGVQQLDDSTIEVKLYGDGRLVVKKKQVITPGELLVLAGEDKNDTAWFVALSRLEKEKEKE